MPREKSDEEKGKVLAERIRQARLVIMGFRNKRAKVVPAGRRGRGKSSKRR